MKDKHRCSTHQSSNERSSNLSYIMSFASLGHYRLRTINVVHEHFGSSLKIFAGQTSKDNSIKLINNIDFPELKTLVNIYAGPFLLQKIKWGDYIKADVLLLDLNPRAVDNWILLFTRGLLRKRTILWGHAWPRGGMHARSKILREVMKSLATEIVTYTLTEASQLIEKFPSLKIYAAPNSLYYKSEMEFDDESDRFRIVYVGRFPEDKKPDQLIKAFIAIAEKLPSKVRLTMVGDGKLYNLLKNLVSDAGIQDRVDLPGYIGDREALERIYAEAFVSVSPGYVGLSITQSFAFGVPMLISRDEPHAPEIEAAVDGENCQFFDTDSIESLSRGILAFWGDREDWRKKGGRIVDNCKERYCVELMADGLIRALESR